MTARIFLISLAFFAIQVYATANINSITDHQVGDFIDDATKLWNKLLKIVKDAVDAAKQKIIEILSGIQDVATKIIENAKTAIDATLNELLERVKELKEKAKEAGVDISECTKENENHLKELGPHLKSELISCVIKQVNEAVNIVNDTITQVDNVYKEVAGLGDKIRACGTGVAAMKCIAKISANMALELAQLPLDISADVKNASAFITTLKSDMEICATWGLGRVALEGGLILVNITKCANDKLHPTTTIIYN